MTGLVGLGSGLLGYTLSNCTIGVYEGAERVWRVKSKHEANSVCSIEDEHCDANTLLSGWQNGKVLLTIHSHTVPFLQHFQCTVVLLL